MNVRRKILIGMAIAIGLADGVYILRLRFDLAREMKAEWIAYMPALEEKQRRNPQNFLTSAHSHDPEYPPLYIFEGDQTYPLFVKLANDCKIREFEISHYLGSKKDREPVDMPDRLYVGKLNPVMEACLRRSIPNGYVLARLEHPAEPMQIGWGSHDLHLAKLP